MSATASSASLNTFDRERSITGAKLSVALNADVCEKGRVARNLPETAAARDERCKHLGAGRDVSVNEQGDRTAKRRTAMERDAVIMVVCMMNSSIEGQSRGSEERTQDWRQQLAQGAKAFGK